MARPFQLFRFSRWLLHRMGMQGHLPLALVDDVQPVLPLWSDDDLENLYLREEHRFATYQNQAAVPGSFSAIALQNPSQSGVLAVVEDVRVFTTPAGMVRFGCVHTPLLPSIPAVQTVLDSRKGDPGTSAAMQSVCLASVAYAVSPLTVNAPRFAAGIVTLVPWAELPTRGVVVDPGSYFVVESNIANVELSGTMVWRTVPMLPPEASLATGP